MRKLKLRETVEFIHSFKEFRSRPADSTAKGQTWSGHRPGQLSPWKSVSARPFLLGTGFGPSFPLYKPASGRSVGQVFSCLPRPLSSGLALAVLVALHWFISALYLLSKGGSAGTLSSLN